MSRSKSKSVEVQIRHDGKTIAKLDGTAHDTESGVVFVGVDPDNLDNNPTKIKFPLWRLNKAGQPKRSAQKNMTLILQNHLVMKNRGVKWSLAPGFWEKPVDGGTIARAKASAKPHIRFVITTEVDGRILAIAFMHDDNRREMPDFSGGTLNSDVSGPAWVMLDGDEMAEFVSNVELKTQ